MEIPDKIIIEAYKEIKGTLHTIPSTFKLESKIKYYLDAKAYDYVYGLGESDVTEDEIIKGLLRNRIMFRGSDGIVNNPQSSVIEIWGVTLWTIPMKL